MLTPPGSSSPRIMASRICALRDSGRADSSASSVGLSDLVGGAELGGVVGVEVLGCVGSESLVMEHLRGGPADAQGVPVVWTHLAVGARAARDGGRGSTAATYWSPAGRSW